MHLRFPDSVSGGAWSFLVRELICLVYSANEREPDLLMLGLLGTRAFSLHGRGELKHARRVGLGKPAPTRGWTRVNNRSVMPLDALGCTRATMEGGAGTSCAEVRRGILQSPSCPGSGRVTRPANKEFLVVMGHQPVTITSLLFVHTARRSYRLGREVRTMEVRRALPCPMPSRSGSNFAA